MKNLSKFILSVLGIWMAGTNCHAQFGNKCATSAGTQSVAASSTACIQFLKDFIPSSSDPVLEVKVHFWVLSPSPGSGLYDWWGGNDTTDADNLLYVINNTFTYLTLPHLSMPGNPWVQYAKIKFVRSGWTATTSTSQYTYIPSNSQAMAAMGDPDALNLFFGDCSATGAASTACIFLGQVNPRYEPTQMYNNVIGFAAREQDQPQQQTLNFLTDFGNVIVHEISHALGNIYHTAAVELFNNYIYPFEGCCPNAIFSDDYQREGSGVDGVDGICTNTAVSNNITGRNLSCMTYLSPQQCAIMQYNLRTVLKNILTTNSYTSGLQNSVPNYDVVYPGETWDTDRYFKGDVTVPTGRSLTINCRVGMVQKTKIVVEKGALLIINASAHITNISGQTWRGIEVLGNPTLDQSLNGPDDFATNQGIVWMNGGKISQADVAIKNYRTDVYGNPTTYTLDHGGIVIASGANFLNNVRDIDFRGFIPPSSSYFANCQFKTDGVIGDGKVPIEHVRLSGLRNLKFWGCNFEYDAGNLYANRGKGIFSDDAGYAVDQLCGGSSWPCTQSTTFRNLDYGIYVDNTMNLNSITVKNSEFYKNFFGAYVHNMNYVIFDKNYFTNRSLALGAGLYLNQCKYFNIKNNTFLEDQNGHLTMGVWVHDSREGEHTIYHNTFGGLWTAINAINNNSGVLNGTDGAKNEL